MNAKIAMSIFFGVIAIMASSVYVGMNLREIEIAKDCLRLGAFEVRGGFYECELKVVDYEESEGFQ